MIGLHGFEPPDAVAAYLTADPRSGPMVPQPQGMGQAPGEKAKFPTWAVGGVTAMAAYVLKSGRIDSAALIFGIVGMGVGAGVKNVVKDPVVVGVASFAATWFFYDVTGLKEGGPSLSLGKLWKGRSPTSPGNGAGDPSYSESALEDAMEECSGAKQLALNVQEKGEGTRKAVERLGGMMSQTKGALNRIGQKLQMGRLVEWA